MQILAKGDSHVRMFTIIASEKHIPRKNYSQKNIRG